MPNHEIMRTPEVALRTKHHLRPLPLVSAWGLTMKCLWVFAVFLCTGPLANACECKYEFLNDRTVRDANHINIVQVVSLNGAEEQRAVQAPGVLTGKLRVVEVLRGEDLGDTFTFSDSNCCGIRLIEGHHYAVFLEQIADEVFLSPGNALHVGVPSGMDRRKAGLLRRVINGEFKLENAFGEFPSGSLLKVAEPMPRGKDSDPN